MKESWLCPVIMIDSCTYCYLLLTVVKLVMSSHNDLYLYCNLLLTVVKLVMYCHNDLYMYTL